MEKLIGKLEEFTGCTLIFNLENESFYTNGSIENFHYKVDGDTVTLHEEKEDEVVSFKINTTSITEITDGGERIAIIFNDNTMLLLEIV